METKSTPGGKRAGAGRKLGSGGFGEPTELVRIPASQVEKVNAWLDSYKRCQATKSKLPEGTAIAHSLLPLSPDIPETVPPDMSETFPVGFPSQAEDYSGRKLDLNEHLIRNRDATFLARVSGTSMVNAGINDGDELIVDRSLTPEDGSVIVVVRDAELVIKQLKISPEGRQLCSANPDFPDITLTVDQELRSWGVVTCVLHKVQGLK